MKYITEVELRDLYKTEPFTTFVLEPDKKLTPGARQFLVDRGVTLVPTQSCGRKESSANETKQVQENWCTLRLRGRMECLDSLFLLAGAEISNCGDDVLAEQVLVLGKCFRNVQKSEREQVAPEKVQSWEWSEKELENCSSHLRTDFDSSEFHLRLKNGKELAVLNHLRANLREIETAILEAYWNEEKQTCTRQDLIDRVNLIINILSIMMWKCLGGQKWQR